MSKYSSDIEAFMSQDDLAGLIRFLKVLPETDKSGKTSLSTMSGRLTKLENDRSIGILSQEQYTRERNQIRYGIIQISNNIEIKIQKIEENEDRRKKYILATKRYGLGVIAAILIIFIGFKIYDYISYSTQMNIPYKYARKKIDKDSISSLYEELEKDSTLGNESFNGIIKYFYSVSRGRIEYFNFNQFDSAYFDFNAVVDSAVFQKKFDDFIVNLKDNKITYGKIYEELEYEDYLKEELLYDEIQAEYAKIDKICVEIQDEVDRKYQMAESISNNIDVDFFNVNLNKTKRQLEARTTIRNGTGKTLYSVSARMYVYVFNSNLRDTLTSVVINVDQPEGIDAVYKQSLDYYSVWNQPYIYNEIKNYNALDLRFGHKILEANLDRENYDVSWIYRPDNLPYNATLYRNENYQSPEKLTGRCPYLSYRSKEYEEVQSNVNSLIKNNLKENGYNFGDLYKELSFRNKN